MPQQPSSQQPSSQQPSSQQPHQSSPYQAPVHQASTSPSGRGEPTSRQAPGPPALGQVRLATLVAAGLGVVIYLLGFFSDVRLLQGLAGPLLLAGALLSGLALLPKPARVLAPAAVIITTGALLFLQTVVASRVSALGIVVAVLAVVQAAAAVFAVLLEAGVVSVPAPRPGSPAGSGQPRPGGYPASFGHGPSGYGQPGHPAQPGFGQQQPAPFGGQPQQPYGQPQGGAFGAQPGYGQQHVPPAQSGGWHQPVDTSQSPTAAWYAGGDPSAQNVVPTAQHPQQYPGSVPTNAQPTNAQPTGVQPTGGANDPGATAEYRPEQGTETPAVGQPIVPEGRHEQSPGSGAPTRYLKSGESSQNGQNN